MKQIELLKKENKAYGGELLKTRKGRSQGRPLDTRNTMHLVLRSEKAKGEWSFKRPKNEKKISEITDKFSRKYGVKILSLANVGNHLHFQIKLTNRFTYKPFIRAITSAIAMSVTGVSRWNKIKNQADRFGHGSRGHGPNNQCPKGAKDRFWDYRPFTRVITSFKALLNLRDYIHINQLEGFGVSRIDARFILASKSVRTAVESG